MDPEVKSTLTSDGKPTGELAEGGLEPPTADPRQQPPIVVPPLVKSADMEVQRPEPRVSKVTGTPLPPIGAQVEEGLRPAAAGSDPLTLEQDQAQYGHPVFGFPLSNVASIVTKSDVAPPCRMAGGVSPHRRRKSADEDPGFVQLGPKGELQYLSSSVTFDPKTPPQEEVQATSLTVGPPGVGISGDVLGESSVIPDDSISRAGMRFHVDGRSVAGSTSHHSRSTTQFSEAYRQKAEVLKEQRDAARRQVRELEAKYREQERVCKKREEEQQQKFREECCQYQARCDQLQQEYDNLREKSERLEDEWLERGREGASVVNGVEAATKLQDLQAQLDRQSADIRVLSSQVEAKNQENQELRAQLTQSQNRQGISGTEMDTLKARIEKYVTTLDNERQCHSNQVETLRRTHVERENDLTQNVTKFKDIALREEKRAEHLQRQVAELTIVSQQQGADSEGLLKQVTEYIRRLQVYHPNAANLGQDFNVNQPPLRIEMFQHTPPPPRSTVGFVPSPVGPSAPPSGGIGNPTPSIFAAATWPPTAPSFSAAGPAQPTSASTTQPSQGTILSANRPKIKNLPPPTKLDITKKGFTHVAFQTWTDALRRYFSLSGYEEILWPQMVPYYIVGYAERRVTSFLQENPNVTFDAVIDFIQNSVLPKRNVAASFAQMRSMTYVKERQTLREFYDDLIRAQQETRGVRDLQEADYSTVREVFFSKLPSYYQDYIMQQLNWESMDAQELIRLAEHHEFRYTVKDSLASAGTGQKSEQYRTGQPFFRRNRPGFGGSTPRMSAQGVTQNPRPGNNRNRPRNRMNQQTFGRPGGARFPPAQTGRVLSGDPRISSNLRNSAPPPPDQEQRRNISPGREGNGDRSFTRAGSQQNLSNQRPCGQTPSNRPGICFNCGEPGHYRFECRQPRESGRGYVSEISEVEQHSLRGALEDGTEVKTEQVGAPVDAIHVKHRLSPFEHYSNSVGILTLDEEERYSPKTHPVRVANIKEGPVKVDCPVSSSFLKQKRKLRSGQPEPKGKEFFWSELKRKFAKQVSERQSPKFPDQQTMSSAEKKQRKVVRFSDSDPEVLGPAKTRYLETFEESSSAAVAEKMTEGNVQWPTATLVIPCNRPFSWSAYPDSFARSQNLGTEGGARAINSAIDSVFSQFGHYNLDDSVDSDLGVDQIRLDDRPISSAEPTVTRLYSHMVVGDALEMGSSSDRKDESSGVEVKPAATRLDTGLPGNIEHVESDPPAPKYMRTWGIHMARKEPPPGWELTAEDKQVKQNIEWLPHLEQQDREVEPAMRPSTSEGEMVCGNPWRPTAEQAAELVHSEGEGVGRGDSLTQAGALLPSAPLIAAQSVESERPPTPATPPPAPFHLVSTEPLVYSPSSVKPQKRPLERNPRRIVIPPRPREKSQSTSKGELERGARPKEKRPSVVQEERVERPTFKSQQKVPAKPKVPPADVGKSESGSRRGQFKEESEQVPVPRKAVPIQYERQRGPFTEKRKNQVSKRDPRIVRFTRGCPQMEPHVDESVSKAQWVMGHKGNLSDALNIPDLTQAPYSVLVYVEDDAMTTISAAAAIQREQTSEQVKGEYKISDDVLQNIHLFCNTIREFCSTPIEAMVPTQQFTPTQNAVLDRFRSTSKLFKTTAAGAFDRFVLGVTLKSGRAKEPWPIRLESCTVSHGDSLRPFIKWHVDQLELDAAEERKRSLLEKGEGDRGEQFGPGELFLLQAQRSISVQHAPGPADVGIVMDTTELECPMLDDDMLLKLEKIGNLTGFSWDNKDSDYTWTLIEVKILRYDQLLLPLCYYVDVHKEYKNLVDDIIVPRIIDAAEQMAAPEMWMTPEQRVFTIQLMTGEIRAGRVSLRQMYLHVFKEGSKAGQTLAFGSYKCDYRDDVPYPFPMLIMRPTVVPIMEHWTRPPNAVTGKLGNYWLETTKRCSDLLKQEREKTKQVQQLGTQSTASSTETTPTHPVHQGMSPHGP